MKWVIFALALAGCEKRGTPVDVEKSADNYEVERLFDRDHCAVYQFYDIGRHHYFASCPGSTSQAIDCGKGCEYQEEIQTLEGHK